MTTTTKRKKQMTTAEALAKASQSKDGKPVFSGIRKKHGCSGKCHNKPVGYDEFAREALRERNKARELRTGKPSLL